MKIEYWLYVFKTNADDLDDEGSYNLIKKFASSHIVMKDDRIVVEGKEYLVHERLVGIPEGYIGLRVFEVEIMEEEE